MQVHLAFDLFYSVFYGSIKIYLVDVNSNLCTFNRLHCLVQGCQTGLKITRLYKVLVVSVIYFLHYLCPFFLNQLHYDFKISVDFLQEKVSLLSENLLEPTEVTNSSCDFHFLISDLLHQPEFIFFCLLKNQLYRFDKVTFMR
jgi:hypothetical protein